MALIPLPPFLYSFTDTMGDTRTKRMLLELEFDPPSEEEAAHRRLGELRDLLAVKQEAIRRQDEARAEQLQRERHADEERRAFALRLQDEEAFRLQGQRV